MKKKRETGNWINHVKKYYKWYVIGGIILAGMGFGAYTMRQDSLSKAAGKQLEDLPRTQEAVEDAFYSRQLTVEENENFQYLKERIENLQGGVVKLPHPVNGREYERLITALECEGGNYFYGCYEVPMTDDGVYVMYKQRDYEKIVDRKISQIILFLSCAEGLELSGKYTEDGHVENLEKVNEKLTTNDPEKVEEIHKVLKDTEEILEQVVEGLPEEAGEKTTVDYFLNWMDENLEFHQELAQAANSVTNMGEVLEHIYKYNHLAVVTEGKAIPLGYAKVLSELCNRAGMKSHLVMGKWKGSMMTSESYVLVAVEMNGQTIYVDASGAKGNRMGGERYLREIEAKNHMEFIECFSYAS